MDSRRHLFKFRIKSKGEGTTGEDWSEKVCSELCNLLNLPHAEYDFAEWKSHKGVICPSFVPENGRLVLGNELLVTINKRYPKEQFYKVQEHTLKVVLAIMKWKPLKVPIDWSGLTMIETALDVFIGYLMLDAWIGNQDRHHENWGLIVGPDLTVHLAPTFDHASSLGWNLPDHIREERLKTNDQRKSVKQYVERARSAFFASRTSEKPMSTMVAFTEAMKLKPSAGRAWLQRIQSVPKTDISAIFSAIPKNRISPLGMEFALKMLEVNRERLVRALK
jgi:hypothetical protein